MTAITSPTAPSPSTTIGAFSTNTVHAAGFDVTYYESGSGSPIVFLPGAGGPAIGPAHHALAEQFRVLVVELPGWGSAPNDVADMDGLADQVDEILTAIGLDTYHLVGTSFGGACALHLVTRHPEHVISLTLEAPAKFRVDSANPARLEPAAALRAFRVHPERGRPMSPPDPELMARVWPTVHRLMGDEPVDPSFLERLRHVSIRTLVMFGMNDGIINPVNGRTYRAAMPNCVLMHVYDAAHDIANDRPEMFVDVISDFVRRGMNFLVNDADRLINP